MLKQILYLVAGSGIAFAAQADEAQVELLDSVVVSSSTEPDGEDSQAARVLSDEELDRKSVV